MTKKEGRNRFWTTFRSFPHSPSLTGEEAEVQRGEIIFLKSCTLEVRGWDSSASTLLRPDLLCPLHCTVF